ncbi:MAG TPA: phosphatase PAP2 family protein [Myxococcales bacterium LLY-WYZ-16_1]|nr:phosphatase PAP2 family protein [Myxococcales bacterium LLY-WYZ-16_1]
MGADQGISGVAGRCCIRRGANRVWVVFASGALAVTSVAPSARAQEFSVDGAEQGLVAAGLWLTAFLLDAEKRRWTGLSPCEGAARPPTATEWKAFERLPPDEGLCDPSRILGLDRALRPGAAEWAATGSDLLLLGTAFSPLAYAVARDVPPERSRAEAAGADAVVTLQVLGATALATNVLKLLVRRPRPLTYDRRFDKEARFDGDARASFPSGHTSVAFAGASMLAVMVTERSRDPGVQAATIAGAYGAAGLVGLLRVLSGRHFTTDVWAGAALGTGLGWLIPQAHLQHTQGARWAVGGRF